MRERQQNSTTHPLNFLLVLSSDHLTGATGITPTVTISKDGGGFASPAGAVAEIGSGWYSLAGNATDRNTLGSFLLHATGTGCDPADRDYTIVGYDPFNATTLGIANLDAAISSRSTYAGGDTAGTTTLLVRLTAGRATNLDNLDAAVSSRSTYAGGAVASVTAPVTLPANPPAGFLIAASYGTAPGWYTTPPTSAAIATAVWTTDVSSGFTGGQAGAKLNAAGSAGDPWGGVITASQAGTIVRNSGAVLLGNLAEPSDHSTSTFTDAIDGVTTRVTSTNTATGRTVAQH